MKPELLLNRWAREGELPPSPAPHPQKQNLAVYTKELTHPRTLVSVLVILVSVAGLPFLNSSIWGGSKMPFLQFIYPPISVFL